MIQVIKLVLSTSTQNISKLTKDIMKLYMLYRV